MKLVGALALLTLCGVAAAGDDPLRGCPAWACRPAAPCPACPDDYCPKPLPAIGPTRYCGPNDYRPKPLPSVCPVTRLGTDDYCPKSLPCVARCYSPPSFTCGPDRR